MLIIRNSSGESWMYDGDTGKPFKLQLNQIYYKTGDCSGEAWIFLPDFVSPPTRPNWMLWGRFLSTHNEELNITNNLWGGSFSDGVFSGDSANYETATYKDVVDDAVVCQTTSSLYVGGFNILFSVNVGEIPTTLPPDIRLPLKVRS
jgi:hypothetical protein